MPEGLKLERRNGEETGNWIGICLFGLAESRREWEKREENAGEELEECSGNWVSGRRNEEMRKDLGGGRKAGTGRRLRNSRRARVMKQE